MVHVAEDYIGALNFIFEPIDQVPERKIIPKNHVIYFFDTFPFIGVTFPQEYCTHAKGPNPRLTNFTIETKPMSHS
jgi:hypothetical protein